MQAGLVLLFQTHELLKALDPKAAQARFMEPALRMRLRAKYGPILKVWSWILGKPVCQIKKRVKKIRRILPSDFPQ
jgi:hypothetical protein